MNSTNKMPFKKRSDPFSSESKKTIDLEPKEEKVNDSSSVETIKDPFGSAKSSQLVKETLLEPVEEKKIIVEAPKKVIEVVEKKEEKPKEVQKEVKKIVVVKETSEENREKYTATMDKELRIRVKKAAIDLGLQVSSFIEVACLEKLEREGK